MHAQKHDPDRFQALRQQAEALIKDIPVTAPSVSDDILHLMHELNIHQTELEIQNAELQRAQKELAALHREYEDLYQFAPCGYVSLNAKRIISRVNRTGMALLNFSAGQKQTRAFSQFVDPDHHAAYFHALEKAVSTGGKQTLELKLVRGDGTSLWGMVEIVAVAPVAESDVHWQVMVMDITSLKRIEDERERMENQLRQTEKLETVGTLAGGVAHEFNNILGIIIGHNELATDALPPSSPIRAHLEEVRIAGFRARDVVRQLLMFSRKSDTKQEPIEAATVVKDALNLIRTTIPANIDVQQAISGDTRPIMGNATQMNQLIINLCGNAADAIGDAAGSIAVEMDNVTIDGEAAEQYAGLQPGPHVRLVVRDTGCGIEPRRMKQIFEPFYTTKAVGKGTGIGLSVVHGIVERHHGDIRVESTPGTGTTFTILFPAFRGAVAAELPARSELPKGTERILFVDDESSLLRMSERSLSLLGYRVCGTTDPEAALDQFRKTPDDFDLVVTDMAMPHMTGAQLASEIQNIRRTTPMILCSGYSENVTPETAAEMGFHSYAVKPISLKDLAHLVRAALDSKTPNAE